VGDQLFMAAFGDDDQAFAIADFAFHALGARRFVVWTDETMAFTRALAAFFTQRVKDLGGTVQREDRFTPYTTDFSTRIQKLRALKPDAVFVAGVPAEAGPTVSQIREAGLTLPILSADGFDTERLVSEPGPKLATNVFFATHLFRADDRPDVKTFEADYARRYERAPASAFAALGYDALGMLAEAMDRAGSTEPGAVAAALRTTRGYPGVTGEISLSRPGRAPEKPVSIVAVRNGTFQVEETWRPAAR